MDRAKKNLREKLAHYRRRLSEGVAADVAALYLREIAKAETELRRLKSGDERAPDEASWRLEWSDMFSVGHPILDAQHRDLIRQINRLCTALVAKADMTSKHPELRALIHAAQEHFEHEAAVLKDVAAGISAPVHGKAIDASVIAEHVSAHDRALADLHAIVARIERAVVDDLPRHAEELISWFVIHAIKYDANLKAIFEAM